MIDRWMRLTEQLLTVGARPRCKQHQEYIRKQAHQCLLYRRGVVNISLHAYPHPTLLSYRVYLLWFPCHVPTRDATPSQQHLQRSTDPAPCTR